MSHSRCRCLKCLQGVPWTAEEQQQLVKNVHMLIRVFKDDVDFVPRVVDLAAREAYEHPNVVMRIRMIVEHTIAAYVHFNMLMAEFDKDVSPTDAEFDELSKVVKQAFTTAKEMFTSAPPDAVLRVWLEAQQQAHSVQEKTQRVINAAQQVLFAAHAKNPKEMN